MQCASSVLGDGQAISRGSLCAVVCQIRYTDLPSIISFIQTSTFFYCMKFLFEILFFVLIPLASFRFYKHEFIVFDFC